MTEKRVSAEDFRYFALGAVAALLYGTTVLVPFFAVPLQTSWVRGGSRAFLLSISVAFAGILGWMLWEFRGTTQIGVGDIFLLLALPIGLAASVALLNSRPVSAWPFVYRVIVGGALVAAISLPSIFVLFNNPEIEDYLRKGITDMTASLKEAGGESFSGAVLRSSLDTETILQTSRKIIADSFAALLFIFTFLGHWIGTRMAGNNAREVCVVPRLNEFSVPVSMIWAFLGLWFAVLTTRFSVMRSFPGSAIFEGVAWNAALTVSFCYAVQGFAVFRYFAGKVSPTGPLRWAGTLLVVLLLLNFTTGAWTAGVLTVLGATETWIPYRISKGVQP